MRTPADFSISPHTSNDVISPFGKKFELSDDWLVSGSYISPVIHATRTKKPTVRLISSSPTMSFMDRLQTQYSSSHAPPRHGVPSSSPLLSPFLHSRPSVKKEKLPHPPLRVQAPADDVRLPTLTLPPSRRLLPKFKKLPSPRERRTSPQPAANLLFLISPLSPLTPSPTKSAFLTENACPPVSDPKRKKRSLSMSESPTTRVKRTRYNPRGADTLGHDASPLPGLSLTKTAAAGAPLFSTRTLPSAASFVVSPYFPLFYRRFPVSSYFRPGTTRSPCTLFGMPHPGGEYQAPRNAFDLYAPRFVKGKGSDKVALCPICVEAPRRGGEGKKVWLAVKFSAFDCHMQYHHGISASTRRPLSPPIDFRIVARPSPKQLERTEVQQAKCHKCLRWVAIKTIKDVDMKVRCIFAVPQPQPHETSRSRSCSGAYWLI
ncbi:hypothetical protein DFH07DRAFT_35052 [Mycena maculata]|uniref:Transcription regulator Rua1 C-terminal domain-containing protein n=1 Tax=Mycena maculata TaxID=230809 RepID=A0AAD7IIK3_9AGAR|nr:hypothetical protein DFH07DRAFT_35052 [Mycena maculata]